MGRRLLLLSVIAATLIAGCGGGSSKLSHDEFVKKANAICGDYNSKTAKLGTPNSFDTVVTYAQQLQSIAKDAVGKFKKLNPPDDERANWQAFAKTGDELIAAAGQLEQAGKDQDTAKLQQLLSEAQARSAESHRIGAKMGTPACAST